MKRSERNTFIETSYDQLNTLVSATKTLCHPTLTLDFEPDFEQELWLKIIEVLDTDINKYRPMAYLYKSIKNRSFELMENCQNESCHKNTIEKNYNPTERIDFGISLKKFIDELPDKKERTFLTRFCGHYKIYGFQSETDSQLSFNKRTAREIGYKSDNGAYYKFKRKSLDKLHKFLLHL